MSRNVLESEQTKKTVIISFGQIVVDTSHRRAVIIDVGNGCQFETQVIVDEGKPTERLGICGTVTPKDIKSYLSEQWNLLRIINSNVRAVGDRSRLRIEETMAKLAQKPPRTLFI